MILLSLALVAAADSAPEPEPPTTRVEVAVYDTAATLPVRRTLGLPVHPGVEVGLAHALTRRDGRSLSATARLGAFSHSPLTRALTLDAGLQGAWRPASSGFVGSAEWLLGGQVGTPTQREFAPDGQGGFEERSGRVRAQVRTGLRLAVGWRLGRAPRAPELLAFHRLWVETPFAPGFIPVVPHGDTGLLLTVAVGRSP